MTNCITCKKLGRTCVMCQAEAERNKRPALKGAISPLSRLERDREATHG